MIPMPPRNTAKEVIAQAISHHIKSLCERHFGVIAIGDSCDVVSGGTPSTSNPDYWDGETAWVTPRDLGKPRDVEIRESERHITSKAVAHSSARILPIGTVVLSSRAPIGHLAITGAPLATNQGCKNIVCHGHLRSRFLFHMLRGSIDELRSHGRGNTFEEIPARVVKALTVPMPPVEVQDAVSNFLDASYLRLSGQQADLPALSVPLDHVRSTVQKVEQLAGKTLQLQKAIERRQEKVAALRTSVVGGLFAARSGWHMTTLSDVCERPQYGFTASATTTPVGPQMLRITDIQAGVVNWHNVPYCECAKADAYLLKPGDILVARTGATTGKSYLVRDAPRAVFASYLIRLRVIPSADPEYVYQFLQSPQYWAQVADRVRGTGQPNCSASTLSGIGIPLPSGAEQRAIAAHAELLQERVMHIVALGAHAKAGADLLVPSGLRTLLRATI